jgi:hypothetical protein
MTAAVAITDIPPRVSAEQPSEGRAKLEDGSEITVWNWSKHAVEFYGWIGLMQAKGGEWVITEIAE